MSSFYGNIKSGNRVGLTFDKIYPNRKTMDENCSSDGIFNNRFVLINYGEIETFPFTRVFPTKEQFQAGIESQKYWFVKLVKPSNDISGSLGYDPESVRPFTAEDIDAIYDSNGVILEKAESIYIKKETALNSKTLGVNSSVDFERQPNISEFVQNKEIDLAKYGDQFQHTVWQKIWTQTGSAGTVIEKYIKVADLDAAAPIFNIVIDAPSDEDYDGFKLVVSATDLEDGYITKEEYDDYNINLFYIQNDNYIPIYQPITENSDIDTIYYKNELNQYTTVPNDGQKYQKAAYDKNKQYWEIVQLGRGPHFDPLKSTDLEYIFHMPRPWKIAKEVSFDYNAKGFLPYEKSFEQYGPNKASFEIVTDEDKLTTLYPVHMEELPDAAEYNSGKITKGPFINQSVSTSIKMSKQADTKQLGITLPEIGKAVSDIWDVMYPRGIMTKIDAENVPTGEFDNNFNNLLLTEEGLAKYYYLDFWVDGRISASEFNKLIANKKQLLIKIINDEGAEQFIESYAYDPNAYYYTIEEGQRIIVPSDIKVYYPATKNDLEKELYTFTKDPRGETRIMYLGNDREVIVQDYPYAIAEALRKSLAILGLPYDNDFIHPERKTVYGLLNGAKTLYGSPEDSVDNGYHLIPSDIPNKEDGYISENLFNYLINNKQIKIYYKNPTNTKELIEAESYDTNILYYYNLNSLYAYFNEFKELRSTYHIDWNQDNSDSIQYIQNRPKIIGSKEINDIWNQVAIGR